MSERESIGDEVSRWISEGKFHAEEEQFVWFAERASRMTSDIPAAARDVEVARRHFRSCVVSRIAENMMFCVEHSGDVHWLTKQHLSGQLAMKPYELIQEYWDAQMFEAMTHRERIQWKRLLRANAHWQEHGCSGA